MAVNGTYAPVPGINDTQNVYQIFNWVSDTVTQGALWIALIWMIWLIALIGNLSEGKSLSRGLIYSNFICAIIGSILTLIGWIDQTWTWFFVVFLGVSLLWNRVER